MFTHEFDKYLMYVPVSRPKQNQIVQSVIYIVSFQKLSELVNDAYKDAHQRSVQVRILLLLFA